tara:strand:+ start:506 stop:1684 length:1179 start_codon:yes stop_codon:yes gene_type:complete
MKVKVLKNKRITSLDLLKGAIMIIMALDHVRDYFHYDAFFFDPTDPTKTNIGLFFTRWITHFCAPTFSLLAGVSAYLIGIRKSKKELSSFLLKRGIWLIFIELTVVNFSWFFDFHFQTFGLFVIWSLGISMIFLAAIIHLKLKHILIFSLMVIFGHNALDSIQIGSKIFWSIIHERNFIDLSNGVKLLAAYPILPWIGVMSFGYYIGSFYDRNFSAEKRKKIFFIIGLSSIFIFFIVRFLNGYGNLNNWKSYEHGVQTVFSFLDPAKYPPSISYLLMTLGPVFFILSLAENLKGKIVNLISVFGKVPFFYYIIHIYIIHLLALITAWITGFGWENMIVKGWVTLSPKLDGFGFTLPYVYVIWIAIVVFLYPFCNKFSNYKQNNKDKKWLSYL